MAEETNLERNLRRAAEKRAARKAEREAADKKAATPKESKPVEKESSSLLDSIRKAFSSEDDIKRIDDAVDAVTRGVEDANTDHKRKK